MVGAGRRFGACRRSPPLSGQFPRPSGPGLALQQRGQMLLQLRETGKQLRRAVRQGQRPPGPRRLVVLVQQGLHMVLAAEDKVAAQADHARVKGLGQPGRVHGGLDLDRTEEQSEDLGLVDQGPRGLADDLQQPIDVARLRHPLPANTARRADREY